MKTPSVCRALGQSSSCTAHSKAQGAVWQMHSRNWSGTGCTHTAGIEGWAECRKIQKLTKPGQQLSHGKGLHISVMADTALFHPKIHTNTYTDTYTDLSAQPSFPNIPSQTFPLISPCLEGPSTTSLSSLRGTGGSDRTCDCSQLLLSHGSQKLTALQEWSCVNRQVQKSDVKDSIVLLNKNSSFAKSFVITVLKKHLKALKSELSSDVLNDIVAVIPSWIASSPRQIRLYLVLEVLLITLVTYKCPRFDMLIGYHPED